MHIERHQQMLRNATSETLAAVITQMKQEHPEAFQIETGANETLSQRRFAYEPATPLPMAGFNVTRKDAAEAIQESMRKASERTVKR
ncbi:MULTISPECIES: hypothetical protein [unclassified Caballeronia]|uniref:hypothetical protein n=1 Tax=unclassified Caballeronia TaxID=2646786 RepID=UPI00285AD9EE|nr:MULTISPECIES: hypothetical protein [unclassified Caballeronia]MDR5775929.1 hypothetical protein [Caballeronia sp. LZ002]MDR5801482.1 hypothetical protein [Caballeronia sp. LZ001]MDR5851368.1 hypothetical protein [Caballeronia sp. LZ003]